MSSKRTLVYTTAPRVSRKKLDEIDIGAFCQKLTLNPDEKMVWDVNDFSDDDNVEDDADLFFDKGFNGLVFPSDRRHARRLLGCTFVLRSKQNSRKYLTGSNSKTRKDSAVDGLIANIELMIDIVKNSANPLEWNKCIIEINVSILCHRYIHHITGEILNDAEVNDLYAKLKSKDFVEKYKVYKLCLVKFQECIFKTDV